MSWETFEIDKFAFDVHVGKKQSVLLIGSGKGGCPAEILLKTENLQEQLKLIAKVYDAIFAAGCSEGRHCLREELRNLLEIKSGS